MLGDQGERKGEREEREREREREREGGGGGEREGKCRRGREGWGRDKGEKGGGEKREAEGEEKREGRQGSRMLLQLRSCCFRARLCADLSVVLFLPVHECGKGVCLSIAFRSQVPVEDRSGQTVTMDLAQACMHTDFAVL